MEYKEALELLRETIENIDCPGVSCDNCPLSNKEGPCEVSLIKERVKNEICCKECGAEL